jgi:ribosomal protein S18 acetylase RimI-like enzyme
MVVLAETRGAGVGGALLDAALAHAARRGCRRVTLLTDADNVAAQRFYQRRGFQHSPMIPMRLLLDTPGIASTEDDRTAVD